MQKISGPLMKTFCLRTNFINLVIIFGYTLNCIFSSYLNIRQLKKLHKEKSHKRLSSKEFENSKSYNIDKLYFLIATEFIKYLVECLLTFYEVPLLCLSWFRFKSSIVNQTLFYASYSFVFQILIEMPLDFFYKFYIEKKHNFSTITLRIFFTDLLKSTLITFIITSLFIPILLTIMTYFKAFYIYMFITIVVLQMLLIFLYPNYIQPLFNNFVELKESPLKQKIEELAKELKFKVNKIFEMNNSLRSRHSNAYLTGLFSEKKIVLFDTLLNEMNDDQILSILCHEFGHSKLWHIPKNLCITVMVEFVYVYVFNLVVNLIESQDIIKIIYFMAMSTIIDIPLKLATNSISRTFEKQADRFAVKMGYAENLKSALIKLHKENKSIVCPDNMYSMFNYSHPTLEERLDNIEYEAKKVE